MIPAENVKRLISEYRKRKHEIKKRLSEFRYIHQDKNERIFSELSYCILTANANAKRCDEAIKELEKRGLLLGGRASQISPRIKASRFYKKKASYIVNARDLLKCKGSVDVKNRLDKNNIMETREWLVKNIKGYSYKEASHFLRNIGLGKNIAILDRHILKNLKKYGVINKIPDSISNKKVYFDIENKMRDFSKKVNIPMEDLDLLFWSLKTGYVFK